jgi:hypothetical protein
LLSEGGVLVHGHVVAARYGVRKPEHRFLIVFTKKGASDPSVAPFLQLGMYWQVLTVPTIGSVQTAFVQGMPSGPTIFVIQLFPAPYRTAVT